MTDGTVFDRHVVYEELDRVRRQFRQMVEGMGPADLARASAGTRWTNRELLFHVLFGYFVVRRLRWLVTGFGHLPAGVSRAFATVLNAGTVPFDWMNWFGSWGGGRVYSPARMVTSMDRVTTRLARQLATESEAALRRGMHLPVRWDPFFRDWMSLAELYRYPTRHFDFHADQLNR